MAPEQTGRVNRSIDSRSDLYSLGVTFSAQLGLTRTLRGLTATFGRLDHEGYDERDTELHLASNRNLGLVEVLYWVRKLQARVLAGDHSSAVGAAMNAQRLLSNAAANFETAEFHLYGALAHAAAWEFASGDQRGHHFEALVGHHKQLEAWAEHNPVTFENRAAIAGAEIARIEGRVLEAQDLLRRPCVRRTATALSPTRRSPMSGPEAFARRLASRELRRPICGRPAPCYRRWGADAKVRQLEQLHPQIGAEESISVATATIQTPVEHLDLATVIKVSEAVAGEIVLDRLIHTIMRTAMATSKSARRAFGDWLIPTSSACSSGISTDEFSRPTTRFSACCNMVVKISSRAV